MEPPDMNKDTAPPGLQHTERELQRAGWLFRGPERVFAVGRRIGHWNAAAGMSALVFLFLAQKCSAIPRGMTRRGEGRQPTESSYKQLTNSKVPEVPRGETPHKQTSSSITNPVPCRFKRVPIQCRPPRSKPKPMMLLCFVPGAD